MVWNINFIFPLAIKQIPTDEHILFRGVGLKHQIQSPVAARYWTSEESQPWLGGGLPPQVTLGSGSQEAKVGLPVTT